MCSFFDTEFFQRLLSVNTSVMVRTSSRAAMARGCLAFCGVMTVPISSKGVSLHCSKRSISRSLRVSSFAGHVARQFPSIEVVEWGTGVENIRMSLGRITGAATSLFPVWTAMCSWLALKYPGAFEPLSSVTVVQTALSVLMLSTGMTLTPAQMRMATRRTRLIALSLIGCYVLMPCLAVLLSRLFALPPALHAGLVLLGIISGGQASNLCTLIAGGDVALSVTMTTASTVLSAVALPSLSALLLSQVLYVKPWAMAKSVTTLVLIPVLLGASVGAIFKKGLARVQPLLPVVGMAAVLVLILGPVSKNASMFQQGFGQLALAVMALHVLGGAIGFVATLALKGGRREAVTIAFETGFKSPVLSFVLAQRHFGEALVALPSVVSIVLLAPLAAACAVLLRATGSSGEAEVEERVAAAAASGRDIETREHKLFCVRVEGEAAKTVPFAALSSEIARARRRRRRVAVWRFGQAPPADGTRGGDGQRGRP